MISTFGDQKLDLANVMTTVFPLESLLEIESMIRVGEIDLLVSILWLRRAKNPGLREHARLYDDEEREAGVTESTTPEKRKAL